MTDVLKAVVFAFACYGVWRAYDDWRVERDEQIRELVYRASRKGTEEAWKYDSSIYQEFPPEARHNYRSN